MESGFAKAKRKTRIGRLAVLAVVCGVFSGAFTGSALADFRVCNATQNLVGVAIGYRAKAGWITEGLVAYRGIELQDIDRGSALLAVLLSLR